MIKIFLISSIFTLSLNLKAEDMRQFLGGTLEEKTDLEKSLEKDSSGSDPFVTESVPTDENLPKPAMSPSYNVPETLTSKGASTPMSEKESLSSVGTEVLGSREKETSYLEFKNSDLLRDMRNKGDKNFAISFFKDTFDYKNSTNNFDRSFRGDTANQVEASNNGKTLMKIPLMMRVSGHNLFYRDWFHLGAGFGLGLGYNGGKGYFSDGSRSNVNFNLWTIPVDASLILEFPMSFMKLGFSGGPSVLGLIQNRSDLPDTNDRKNIRQMSYGYFAGAKINFSLSEMFPSLYYDQYGSYQVTRYFFSLEARTHNYENFKTDGLSVSGTSYGLGFSFEYF